MVRYGLHGDRVSYILKQCIDVARVGRGVAAKSAFFTFNSLNTIIQVPMFL